MTHDQVMVHRWHWLVNLPFIYFRKPWKGNWGRWEYYLRVDHVGPGATERWSENHAEEGWRPIEEDKIPVAVRNLVEKHQLRHRDKITG